MQHSIFELCEPREDVRRGKVSDADLAADLASVVRKDPNLTEQQLIDHCRSQLTGYKVPKHVYFRDDLPKTNVGKILRRALRDEIKA